MKLRPLYIALTAAAVAGSSLYGCQSDKSRDFGSGGSSGEGGADGGAGGSSSGNGGDGGSMSGTGGEAGSNTGGDGGSSGSSAGTGGTGEGGEGGAEPECMPDEESCIDNVANRCNDDGEWESLNACAGDEVDCPNCTIGDTCDDPEDCGIGGCVNGECTECAPEDSDCAGAIPRVCSNSGTWVNQASCSGLMSVCNPDTGECDFPDPLTTPGLVACGRTLESACNVSGGDLCCLVRNDGPGGSPDYVDVYSCTTSSACPPGAQAGTGRHRCDSVDDCPPGDVCCWSTYSDGVQTRCAAECDSTGPILRPVCTPDGDDCPPGQVCTLTYAGDGDVFDFFTATGMGTCIDR